ncbi:hypothetical protein HIR57_01185 [Staphylococcus coagulans]|uniref:Minor structural protein n=1 Tax=Staphylococcus coagulans TaxID=74706 RepID=A0A9X0PGA0_9STAP|nr:hypothetical protein [Staphylococcus coagulans]MBA8772131.1 hypothetical protein [Staphylococcus coagulans]MBA8777385.1 hypothetical protein [Staphylococcus coagulans]MBT2813360.1 hypothetical protein [Staphylococcus coagulans]MBT2815623.1 hypothetical protein [Staphylococcus coagulans]MBT2836988.1 hypothetical protein [Staphylococcus coagulans]
MSEITKARTLTYDGEEVYARSHIDVVDGLDKSKLLTDEQKQKLENINTDAIDVATPLKNGLMSAQDKTKLDALKQFDPSTLTNATTQKAGLMSAEDKQRLDELKTNSNAYDKGLSNTNASGAVIAANINKWPNQTQNVNLSKKVSECQNGIVLVWRSDAEDDNYHYQYVPKYHVSAHSTTKIVHLIPTNSANEFCTKTVIVKDNVVNGTDDNNNKTTKANKVRLHEILEF